MYWMLPLSSRIAHAIVAFPLKYLKQNLSPLPSLSTTILTTLLNRLKLLRNLQKQ